MRHLRTKPAKGIAVEPLVERHGEGRAPLVDMMWQVKIEQADKIIMAALGGPEVPSQAMSALRRSFGNVAARPHIEPLLSSEHERVRKEERSSITKRIQQLTISHDVRSGLTINEDRRGRSEGQAQSHHTNKSQDTGGL